MWIIKMNMPLVLMSLVGGGMIVIVVLLKKIFGRVSAETVVSAFMDLRPDSSASSLFIIDAVQSDFTA